MHNRVCIYFHIEMSALRLFTFTDTKSALSEIEEKNGNWMRNEWYDVSIKQHTNAEVALDSVDLTHS